MARPPEMMIFQREKLSWRKGTNVWNAWPSFMNNFKKKKKFWKNLRTLFRVALILYDDTT
jgi:hypothetical protein